MLGWLLGFGSARDRELSTASLRGYVAGLALACDLARNAGAPARVMAFLEIARFGATRDLLRRAS